MHVEVCALAICHLMVPHFLTICSTDHWTLSYVTFQKKKMQIWVASKDFLTTKQTYILPDCRCPCSWDVSWWLYSRIVYTGQQSHPRMQEVHEDGVTKQLLLQPLYAHSILAQVGLNVDSKQKAAYRWQHISLPCRKPWTHVQRS